MHIHKHLLHNRRGRAPVAQRGRGRGAPVAQRQPARERNIDRVILKLKGGKSTVAQRGSSQLPP